MTKRESTLLRQKREPTTKSGMNSMSLFFLLAFVFASEPRPGLAIVAKGTLVATFELGQRRTRNYLAECYMKFRKSLRASAVREAQRSMACIW